MELSKKIILITQARIGSSRLPGKILKKINESTILGIHLKRLKRSKRITHFIVATTFETDSEKIINIANDNDFLSIQGSTNDVLDRFFNALRIVNAEEDDIVVRVTSDCPLNDGHLIDEVINFYEKGQFDYVSNVNPPSFADGFDVEVFSVKALADAWSNAKLSSQREHVTSYIWGQPDIFKIGNFLNNSNQSQLRLTLDTADDFNLLEIVIKHMGEDISWREYAEYLIAHPEISLINSKQIRNEGYIKSLLKDKQ